MNQLYRKIENLFDKLSNFATRMLGNSITFIVALVTILLWLGNKEFYMLPIRDSVRDVILGVTFLSLFIIQKSFNKFSAALHLKVNELVVSHEPANNKVINLEQKTEFEIIELAKEYEELIEEEKELIKTEKEKKI